MINKLIKDNLTIFRVLEIKNDKSLVIDCVHRAMPKWIDNNDLLSFKEISEEAFFDTISKKIPQDSELTQEQKNQIQQRYGTISLVLPVIADEMLRRKAIEICAKNFSLSKETIRYRLYDFLIYGTANALIPYSTLEVKQLNDDEKNFRWALNKYYYNSLELSLKETYRRMLKDKYCDKNGQLLQAIPSFRRFNYYFYKTVKPSNKIISRKGKGKFMRDYRTLLGEGVREYCKSIGFGMFDSTICDIFLINENGDLLGRPILSACVDAYSHLCLGYSLGFKGGIDSLTKLVKNMNTDKVDYCKSFGIEISKELWNIKGIPHKFITDKGREYVSTEFSQLTELGLEIINLPPYRPELKGCVEKFFDLVQQSYKKQLAKKGVIFADYQERGGIDYRKKACLTLDEFERVIIHCIIHYNTKRIVDLPLELVGKAKPFANEIWNYQFERDKNNIIEASQEHIDLTLLPRTKGQFKRDGLSVNKLRYRNKDFLSKYLTNETCIISYDPNNVSYVWLHENGKYYKFEIIESFLKNKTLLDSIDLLTTKVKVEKDCEKETIQGAIDLYKEIELITDTKGRVDVNVKNVRKHRNNEIKKGVKK